MNMMSHSQKPGAQRISEKGMLMVELNAALGIMMLLIFSLAVPIAWDRAVIRSTSHRAVAMEIVDGEAEILMAGAWKSYGTGAHEYPMPYKAAEALPKGRFVLLVEDKGVALEWRMAQRDGGENVRVRREFKR
ncbi:MAG TPA: hypothetical protein VGH19_01010 [Verrucomicrobiae bacterium]